MFKKIISGAVAIAAMVATTTTATAGGLSDEITESVVEDVIGVPPAGSLGNTPSWLIPVLVLGAIVLVVNNSGGSDDPDPVVEADPVEPMKGER